MASPPAVAASAIFKVATWNIRSGMGARGFTTTTWSDTTQNCTDRSQPMNAWGIGLPQSALAPLAADQSIVAVAVQEAWNCGNPANVQQVLGFRATTNDFNGTALLARWGFQKAPVTFKIDKTQFIVGGLVCLEPACATALPIFSVHWEDNHSDFIPQASLTVDFMNSQPTPQLLMGDLNTFQIDQWNPQLPCTLNNAPGRVNAIAMLENSGFVDAWKATQSGPGLTGMASRAGCGSPSGGLFKRIDYVWSRGLTPLATERFALAPPGGDAPSDHAGLVAAIALPHP